MLRFITILSFLILLETNALSQILSLDYKDKWNNRTSTVELNGREVLMQWFTAPAELYLRKIYYRVKSKAANNSPVQIKVYKMHDFWREENLRNVRLNNGGYYPSDDPLTNFVTPYPELASGEFIDSYPPGSRWPGILGEPVLSDNGAGVPSYPVEGDYTLVDVSCFMISQYDLHFQPGEIFAITIENLSNTLVSDPISEESKIEFVTNKGPLHKGFGAFKFYTDSVKYFFGWRQELGALDIKLDVEYLNDWIKINSVTELNWTTLPEPKQIIASVSWYSPWNAGGIANVLLKYSINGSEYESIAMEPIGGDDYSAYIPSQNVGTQIYYYVVARNTDAQVRQTEKYSYNVYHTGIGAEMLVVFNSSDYFGLIGYPQSYYFGRDDFEEYTPYGFFYDVWGDSPLSLDLLRTYDLVVEITSTGTPGYYNDEVIREWFKMSKHKSYILFGQDWLGEKYNYEDRSFTEGDFEYDILGITRVYNDISLNDNYGEQIPTKVYPVENSLLCGELFKLFKSQETDSIQYDPGYELEAKNWIDGFEVIEGQEVDMFAEARSLSGSPSSVLMPIVTHRSLPEGNKVIFMSFDPLALNSAPKYYWYGQSAASPQVQAVLYCLPATGLADNEMGEINSFELYQNFPNPFNSTTKIKYTIPPVETGHAPSLLRIYDILGREIATLVNEEKASGTYEVTFDASSLSPKGSILTSGVYYFQLRAGEYVETKKMILLR